MQLEQRVMQYTVGHELAAVPVVMDNETKNGPEATHLQAGLFIWAQASQEGRHSSDSDVSCHVNRAAEDAR